MKARREVEATAATTATNKATIMQAETPSMKLLRAQSLGVYEITLKARQEDDPWKSKRVNWANVITALVTYLLVISDVPRAGAKPELNMRRIGSRMYSYFGSYAYGVMTFSRDREHTELNATDGYEPVDHARMWSYVFDTTSGTVRSVARSFDSSTSEVVRCMKYEASCTPLGPLPLQDTFDVLDRIIDTVAAPPEGKLPQLLPHLKPPGDVYQHTRRAGVVNRRMVDLLYEYLSYRLFEPQIDSSYRITHFPNVTGEFDPCVKHFDRPYLCDAGPIVDYKLSADPTDEESASVDNVPDTVIDQVRTTYETFHNTSSPTNITIDVTFFEGFTHPRTYTGGVVVSATADFDIVKLTRVRDCDSESGQCTTIYLEDYRFEGGRIITDVGDWSPLVSVLRVLGQTYFVLRVLALFAACHYAFPYAQRSVTRTLRLFFSEVPSHIVAYGSPVPIILYVIAMMIDGPITNTIIQSAGTLLNGAWLSNPSAIYKIICILMRRQWLLASLSMLFVQLQIMSRHWDRHKGILSVRGHVFSILSGLSMLLGYHHPSFRDSRILKVDDENPDNSMLNIGIYTRDETHQKVSGVYEDILSMICCAVVYMVLVFFLRIIFWIVKRQMRSSRLLRRLSRVTNGEAAATTSALNPKSMAPAGPSLPMTANSRAITKTNNIASAFFCRTNLLPSTCGTLWSLMGLTCGWGGDVLLSVLGAEDEINLLTHKDTLMLMNIVQLSDPLTFLYVKSSFHTFQLFTYRDVESKAMFSVCEDLESVHAVAKERKANKFELIRTTPIALVPFHELVRCR